MKTACWIAFLVPFVTFGPAADPDATSVGFIEPRFYQGVARTVPVPSPPADTLRVSTTSDTPLLLSLPSTVANRAVQEYNVLRGPALSGVAERSFVWIPEGASPGTHEVILRAAHRKPPPDTLVLQIDLES